MDGSIGVLRKECLQAVVKAEAHVVASQRFDVEPLRTVEAIIASGGAAGIVVEVLLEMVRIRVAEEEIILALDRVGGVGAVVNDNARIGREEIQPYHSLIASRGGTDAKAFGAGGEIGGGSVLAEEVVRSLAQHGVAIGHREGAAIEKLRGVDGEATTNGKGG